MRTGSIFSGTQVPLGKIVLLLVGWILKYSKQTLTRETGFSDVTVAKLLSKFRQLLCVWLIETSTKIGGVGKTVEIDESAFGRRKYNRGRITKTRWVVGGVERGSKKCFLKIVERRDQNTLHRVIEEYVEPGTTVMTDCWKGYSNLENLGFRHRTVNHSLNFVDPINRTTHTQNIEAQWSKIKRDMRRRIGRMCATNFETYLIEYTWRSMHETNEECFVDIINAINYFYPL